MWTNFRQALAASIDLLLPPACLLCGQLQPPGHGKQPLCLDCMNTITPLPAGHCSHCAQPFPDSTSSHLCAACLKRRPVFTKVYTAGLYQGSIKTAIHRLKYRNQLILAQPLGQLLSKTIMSGGNGFIPDQIVPVPLHPSRLKARGYNQALEIARPIARQLSTACDTTLLLRIRKTPQQQGLSATERRSNLRNAFTLSSSFAARKILLVDDVMTTGETVRECCRTLLGGGVEEIQVAIVGRA